MASVSWNSVGELQSRTYVCGFCGDKVGPNSGYHGGATEGPSTAPVFIYICSSCNQPTYIDRNGVQCPGVSYGADVQALPPDTAGVYNEARRCMSVGAYTAATMACRKLLMHVAVEKGANPGQNFAPYVDWLVENHYVPPGGGGWVDVIRRTGNEANHELALIDEATAQRVISFVEIFLTFVYELPARVAGAVEPTTDTAAPVSG